MRYLGVDFGSKKVGLALSDENGTMGFPYTIVPNTPALVDDLCERATAERVEAVVIGESRDLLGAENSVYAGAHALGEALCARLSVPVYYEPEMYTTALARRAPERTLKTRSPRTHPLVDASAAALILTSYLSRQTHGHNPH